MGTVWKTTATVVTVFSALVVSQAPEFTQQYRQRIGGAIDELQIIVADFEAKARDSGLDRERALDLYARSTEGFLQDQGLAMRRTFERYESLSAQRDALSRTSAVAQPVVLLRNTDLVLFTNTWNDFVPALPISFAGLVWAVAGGAASALVCGLARALFRRGRARHAPTWPAPTRPASAPPAPSAPAERLEPPEIVDMTLLSPDIPPQPRKG